MRKITSCGVLVVQGDPIKRFLLMEHTDRWDLPKGHVDGNETEIQCALRELEEETSIQAADIELDPNFRFSHQYSVWPKRFEREECLKTLVIYLGRLLDQGRRGTDVKIVPTEHIGFRWVDWHPPHRIQAETIDPLLADLATFLHD